MEKFFRKLIIGSPIEPLVRVLLNKPKSVAAPFDNSKSYWDRRYCVGGTSGAGSYGRLAQFKAEIINDFVLQHKVEKVIEFGCGDGNQLLLSNYKNYIGVDVSETAIRICKKKFVSDPTKTFLTSSSCFNQVADLALSLDVIYHLIEDEIYNSYMSTLFSSAQRFVIVYSSNFEENNGCDLHVRHRRFSDWVETNAHSFELIEHIRNSFPYDERDPKNTSFADFYIFKKLPDESSMVP